MRFAILPLRQLLENGVSPKLIQTVFDDFRCNKDPDVEHFLKNYAIANESIGASRSYLLVDLADLSEGALTLIAFFTIAITDTDYSGVSNTKKRDIMGAYPRVSKEDHFPGYLLAQLARDDQYSKKDFDCSNLLGKAEEIIEEAAGNVGGNIVYLDCKKPLIDYYRKFGYELLPQAEDCGFFKMFKGIPRIVLEEE